MIAYLDFFLGILQVQLSEITVNGLNHLSQTDQTVGLRLCGNVLKLSRIRVACVRVGITIAFRFSQGSERFRPRHVVFYDYRAQVF